MKKGAFTFTLESKEVGSAMDEYVKKGAKLSDRKRGHYLGHVSVAIFAENQVNVEGRRMPYFMTSVELKGVDEGLASHAFKILEHKLKQGYGHRPNVDWEGDHEHQDATT